MATTARGDDPNLRSAVMRMARQVAQMRSNPTSRKARSLVAITPGQSNPGGTPMAPMSASPSVPAVRKGMRR